MNNIFVIIIFFIQSLALAATPNEQACAVRVVKKKQYDALIGNISRNPMMDMDSALKKLKTVSKEYKTAKAICPQ